MTLADHTFAIDLADLPRLLRLASAAKAVIYEADVTAGAMHSVVSIRALTELAAALDAFYPHGTPRY